MEIQEQTSLKGLIQEMVPESMSVIQGKVISASPLKIQAVNDEKLILTESIICLPRHLTDYTVEMTVSHTTENETAHTHAIQDTYTGGGSSSPTTHRHNYTGRKSFLVHSALKVGETVYMLSFNQGKKYYILDWGA
jgi:hypothetical protein